jgi:hypothetical protein
MQENNFIQPQGKSHKKVISTFLSRNLHIMRNVYIYIQQTPQFRIQMVVRDGVNLPNSVTNYFHNGTIYG